MHPPQVAGEALGLKVLVADDSPTYRAYLEALLREDGHQVVLASDGSEAVTMFEAERPDLVLMDIVMPGVDGIEAAQRIGRSEAANHPPIIFLTSLADDAATAGGADIGADCIHKQIDNNELRAQLRAFIRLLQAQRQMIIRLERIETPGAAMRSEAQGATQGPGRVQANTGVLDRRLPQYRVQPAEMFSGDMVMVRYAPGGNLYLLLADAVGHGLAAASNLLPLFDIFDVMARTGCKLSSIAQELNRRVPVLLPAARFVAATLACVDSASGSLEVWNGGNPPALVIDADGAVAVRMDSMQMALGLNEDDPALFEPQRVLCPRGGRLLIFSDGIWENPAFAGADPASAIASLVAAAEPDSGADALVRAAVDAGQGDDLSVVIAPAHGSDLAPAPLGTETRVGLQLGPAAFATENPVDALLVLADSIGLNQSLSCRSPEHR